MPSDYGLSRLTARYILMMRIVRFFIIIIIYHFFQNPSVLRSGPRYTYMCYRKKIRF